MKFIVKYRRSDGSAKTESVMATNRIECINICRKRGMQPLTIIESDKNTVIQNPKKKNLGIYAKIIAFAAVALVIIVSLSLLMISNKRIDKETKEKPQRKHQVAKKSCPPLKVVESSTSVPDTSNTMLVSEKKDPNDPANRIRRETYECKTNKLGKIISLYETEDGKKHMVIAYIEPDVEMSAADQLLAMATASSQNGNMGVAPPLPGGGISSAAFRESISKKVKIMPDDPTEVKAIKEQINQRRAEALELLDEGMSSAKIFEEHHKIMMENDQIRVKCQAELDTIFKSGDMEGVEKYLKTMSAALSQMGIGPLKVPLSDDEIAELNALRMQNREKFKKRFSNQNPRQ